MFLWAVFAPLRPTIEISWEPLNKVISFLIFYWSFQILHDVINKYMFSCPPEAMIYQMRSEGVYNRRAVKKNCGFQSVLRTKWKQVSWGQDISNLLLLLFRIFFKKSLQPIVLHLLPPSHTLSTWNPNQSKWSLFFPMTFQGITFHSLLNLHTLTLILSPKIEQAISSDSTKHPSTQLYAPLHRNWYEHVWLHHVLVFVTPIMSHKCLCAWMGYSI